MRVDVGHLVEGRRMYRALRNAPSNIVLNLPVSHLASHPPYVRRNHIQPDMKILRVIPIVVDWVQMDDSLCGWIVHSLV